MLLSFLHAFLSQECLFHQRSSVTLIKHTSIFTLCIQLSRWAAFGLFSHHGLHLNGFSWTTASFRLALQNHFSSYTVIVQKSSCLREKETNAQNECHFFPVVEISSNASRVIPLLKRNHATAIQIATPITLQQKNQQEFLHLIKNVDLLTKIYFQKRLNNTMNHPFSIKRCTLSFQLKCCTSLIFSLFLGYVFHAL